MDPIEFYVVQYNDYYTIVYCKCFKFYGPDDGQRKTETCCPNELI
jgi:hypothetical protein